MCSVNRFRMAGFSKGIVLISTSEEQHDDGHLKAETCSCQQQPNFAIKLNICCVYDGSTYLFLHCSRHTTGMSHLKILASVSVCSGCSGPLTVRGRGG